MTANPSTANAHRQLLTRLRDNLPPGYTNATVKWPNRKFTTPANNKYLRATVIDQTVQDNPGGTWVRYGFLYVVDVFYPVGDDTLAQLADAELIKAVFEKKRFNGVNTESILISTVGEDGSWYIIQVNIDGYYEGPI